MAARKLADPPAPSLPRIPCETFWTICCPSPAEGTWLQQKGRSPRKGNVSWYLRLLGTHPLKALSRRSRYVSFLDRLPISGGISPLNSLLLRPSNLTRPCPWSVETPSHSPMDASLSQLVLIFQFPLSVAL